jgi:hypothetical protein
LNVNALATQAVRAAARFRANQRIGPADTMCPFDIAERLGISVRFVALPSFEGMYVPTPKPTILVCAERPAGRRRYTCGHELGHHDFRHGTRRDEQRDEGSRVWNPEEFIANRFAAALLMPKLAVESAFARRGWSASKPHPAAVFIVAQHLGVGYTTLVGYLEGTLRCIDEACAVALRRQSLSKLRAQVAGFPVDHDLLLVDEHWGSRAIDLDVGDTAVIPASADFRGDCAIRHTEPIPHLVATAAGTAVIRLANGRSPTSVRVSRRGFSGLAKYRHLQESPDVQ